MHIPTPAQIKSSNKNIISTETEQRYINIIIDEFIAAVKHDKFHSGSNDDEKIIFYPASGYYCEEWAFEKAIEKLRSSGWDVSYRIKTCAMGWYKSIVLIGYAP